MKNDNEKLGRIPALKVDMLRHIHDHGMAVEFNDPKLTALMGRMRQDGRFLLKAGKSWLQIINRGRVTFTRLYSPVGNRTTKAVHYYDSATGLKSRVVDDDTLAAIGSSVLGGHLFGESRQEPCFLWITGGSDQDGFRKWAKLSGWALLGESGLRARAVGDKLEEAGKRRGFAAWAVKEAEARLTVAARLDAAEEIRACKGRAAELLAEFRQREKESAEQLARLLDAAGDGDPARIDGWLLRSNLGKSLNIYQLCFRAIGAECSPPEIKPNYTAAIGGDGEITVSSGIKTGIQSADVLAWLKGERDAPATRYGPLQRVEATRLTGDGPAPVVLIRCGCHVVDASSLSDEFANALAPIHSSSMTDGLPEARFPSIREGQTEDERLAEFEAYKARAEMEAGRALELAKAGLREELSSIRSKVAEFRGFAANREARIAALQGELGRAAEHLGKIDAEMEAITDGEMTVEQANEFAALFLNALAGIKIS